MATQPSFDKTAYCYELIKSKHEARVIKDFNILAAQEAIKIMPDTPTKERDINTLNAVIQRHKDEKEAYALDIATLEKLIDLYKQNKEPA